MQNDESHDADRLRSPDSGEAGDPNRFQPSTKLMDKMERLAKWRIEPSSLTFPGDGREFHGGNATVSQAFWSGSYIGKDKGDDSDAPNSTSQKIVAVKKLKITSDKSLERVLGLTLREARFLVELSDENIIKLEGFAEDVSNGMIWLVFPWEEKGNLRDFIASGDWEIPERIWLIDDVSRGVKYLHSQQPPICHGDLKSVNILVNSEYRAVITDFGSARRLSKNDPDDRVEENETRPPVATSFQATFSASTNTITLTGNEYTLRWAAPELLMDEQPTLRSDIWALGWISYEVMTNTIPFEDVKKDAIVINRVIRGDLPSITGHARMSLIQELCSLMIMCWNIDPGKRPSAGEFQKLIQWMPMVAPNPTTSETRSPELLSQLGEIHQSQGDYANAAKFITEALGLYTDMDDRKGRAETLLKLSDLHRVQHKENEASKFCSEALQICTNIGDPRGRAEAVWGLAEVYRSQGKYDQAVTSYTDALQAYTDLGDDPCRANALYGIGQVHWNRKEYTEAARVYSEALQIYTDGGIRHSRAVILCALAQVHQAQNEFDQSVALYSDAVQILTDIGNESGKAQALAYLGRVRRKQSQYSEAIVLYEQAIEIFAKIGLAGEAAAVSRDAANLRRRLERISGD